MVQVAVPPGENFPATQFVQAPVPSVAEATAVEGYLPATHGEHAVAPVKEYRPAVQAVQPEAASPSVELEVPAAQSVHEAAEVVKGATAVRVYLPAAHA